MIGADLLATGGATPQRRLDNAALIAATASNRTPEEVEERTGIRTRSWAGDGETAAGLAARAVRDALDQAGLEAADLRRLIFVTSTGGDFLIPATANAVLGELGIADSCDAFDLNNACMGFLSAFDVAARTVATGLGPVCVVAAEILSRYLAPENHRPYLVLADAVGAAILGDAGRGGGILAASLGNDGRLRGTVAMAHPGLTRERELIQFTDSNEEITRLATGALVASARRVLDEAGATLDEIEWIVPHQPNGRMLQGLIDRLRLAPERVVPVVQEIGSVGAASMAAGLHALWRQREVRPGDRILMTGVGAGMSYGAILYQVGRGGE